MSINRVVVSGNLTRDPELRQTAGGTSVLSLRMAVNDRRKNASTGQWEDAPNYVDVTIFGQRAEALSRFMRKGAKVGIEGKLRWSEWESPAGEKRSKLEIIADEVELFSGRESGGGGGGAQAAGGPIDDLEGEEIPF
ncbi:MAG: single-stranded DNA-binding protein [Coriobacteriia bacterium]|nr:single-stranded DNA-binding protein [Coriobacteriia bacterium]